MLPNHIRTSWGEQAWSAKDIFLVLKYHKENQFIILGGDVLTPELIHNYASWFYNVNPKLSKEENVQQSYEVARRYLERYTGQFGYDDYVVLVVK